MFHAPPPPPPIAVKPKPVEFVPLFAVGLVVPEVPTIEAPPAPITIE
jgi:hypothetical protein